MSDTGGRVDPDDTSENDDKQVYKQPKIRDQLLQYEKNLREFLEKEKYPSREIEKITQRNLDEAHGHLYRVLNHKERLDLTLQAQGIKTGYEGALKRVQQLNEGLKYHYGDLRSEIDGQLKLYEKKSREFLINNGYRENSADPRYDLNQKLKENIKGLKDQTFETRLNTRPWAGEKEALQRLEDTNKWLDEQNALGKQKKSQKKGAKGPADQAAMPARHRITWDGHNYLTGSMPSDLNEAGGGKKEVPHGVKPKTMDKPRD